MKHEIDLKTTVALLGFFSIISIICISFLTWRTCDDFYFEKALQNKGVLGYMYYLYKNWDGRFLSLAAFIQIALFKYLNLKFVVFIWSLFFIANSILIIKILFKELDYVIKLTATELVVLISIISVSLFYGFCEHISETVFWATGGVYMLNAFLGLLWLVTYRKVITRPKACTIVTYSIFSLIVGMLTQNLGICLLVFLMIEGVLMFYQNERGKILVLGLFGFCLIIGLAITSFSPGSWYRISQISNSFDKNPVNYFKYFYDISKVFLRASIFLIPISILSAVAVFFNINVKAIDHVKQRNNKLISFLIATKWLIISSSSILTFLFIPKAAGYRAALFFMFFLFIFILVSVNKILSKLETTDLFKYKKTINIFLLIIFVCHLGYISYCYKLGHDYQSYMANTDRYLRTQKNSAKEVIIKNKVLPYYPFIFNIKNFSLTDNPDYWINKDWSFYYGVKIKAE